MPYILTLRVDVKTVLLNLDIKKQLPNDGVEWLFVRVSTKQIKNGRMDLDIIILDDGGDIVALRYVLIVCHGSRLNCEV